MEQPVEVTLELLFDRPVDIEQVKEQVERATGGTVVEWDVNEV